MFICHSSKYSYTAYRDGKKAWAGTKWGEGNYKGTGSLSSFHLFYTS